MIKLKKIIVDLHQNDFNTIEENLVKTGADNFLFLLRSYRDAALSDNEIIKDLSISSNSYYVLKSRLYDKLQEYLSGNIYTSKEEVIKLLHQIPEMCYSRPREVATAFLEKLEKDLLYFDMHNELIVVYSAFKKINLYSQKYFHFSQLFNKHIAFSLSLEKSDEILGNFNRVLRQFDFSRSTTDLETLLFLRKEITDHYTLNPSRQIEIIKNLIELMLVICCHTDLNSEFDVDEKLKNTAQLIDELPPSMSSSNFSPALDFLFFEYLYQRGQTKSATTYYERLNSGLSSLLLYSNTCPSAIFLISKISFLQDQQRISELKADASKELLFDSTDFHSVALLGIYKAMTAYYLGNYKEASARLNELLNLNSFKDHFHISCDIKLTLCFIYIKLGDLELADNILKSIYRKIKAQNMDNYANVLDIIKVLGEEVKHVNHKPSAKQRDSFALFMARNTKNTRVLCHLIHELRAKYS